jgi:hypothetical protein
MLLAKLLPPEVVFLGVTARAANLAQATAKAYEAVGKNRI